jgi:hypothetical protein
VLDRTIEDPVIGAAAKVPPVTAAIQAKRRWQQFRIEDLRGQKGASPRNDFISQAMSVVTYARQAIAKQGAH